MTRTQEIRALLDRDAKPTVPEVLPFVRELYAEHAAGGCLHIVLDDGNLEDHCVRFCIEDAEQRSPEWADLCRVILRMSKTQRTKLHVAPKY